MKHYHFTFLIFFFLFQNLTSQIKIEGVVKDENNIPISQVRVSIKGDGLYNYNFTDSDGKYKFDFDKITGPNIFINASSTLYNNETINLNIETNKREYSVDFKLLKKTKDLQGIIIQGKRTPIEIKKDTVVYNPENFADGTERNVEDLIKKLPGLKVNESGAIEFKGKTVVAVMLDGGDLFNSNYTLGTKNLDPKIIDQIQAIENWSENPILQRMGAENKVALNLKLKKNKTSFSSSYSLETDFYKRINIGGTLLLTNKLLKGFALSHYNNVGYNKSPVNFSTNSYSLEEYLNLKYKAPLLISPKSVNTEYGFEKANINNQWVNSVNLISNLSKNVNLKAIFTKVDDRINLYSFSENFYRFNNNSIDVLEENKTAKNPSYNSAVLELKWRKSKNEYIEISSVGNHIKENNFSNINRITLDNDNQSVFVKNNITYSYGINSKNALQFSVTSAYHTNNQSLFIEPSLSIFNNLSTNKNEQDIRLQKSHLEFNTVLYHIFSEKHKIKLGAGVNKIHFILVSKLLSHDISTIEDFDNDLTYNTQSIFANLDYSLDKRNWKININQSNILLYQNLYQKESYLQNLFLNKTDLTVIRSLFGKTSLMVSTNLVNRPTEEKYLFENKILVSNRSIVSNQHSLEYETSKNFNLGFIYNDSLMSQFKASLISGYTIVKNLFSNYVFINSNLDERQFQRIPNPSESFNLGLNLEKFIPIISSRFNLNVNIIRSRSYNSFNNNTLNEVKFNIKQVNLIHQFAFKMPLTIKNTFEFVVSENNTNVKDVITNMYLSLKNYLSYSFYNKKLSANFSSEYFNPDLKGANSILFLNSSLFYTPKEKGITYQISLNNILNNKHIITKRINDYSVYFERVELLPRIFLIGAKIGF